MPGAPRRRCTLPRAALPALVAALALLAPFGAAAAADATQGAAQGPLTWVSYPRVLAQLRSGPLIRVIVNPFLHHVEIKFPNLDEWHAVFPAGAQAQITALVRARHIRTIYVVRPHATQRRASGAHPLRWAAVALAGALVLAGAAALALRRRRSSRRPPPTTLAQPPAG